MNSVMCSFDCAYLGMNKSGQNIVSLHDCNIAIVNMHNNYMYLRYRGLSFATMFGQLVTKIRFLGFLVKSRTVIHQCMLLAIAMAVQWKYYALYAVITNLEWDDEGDDSHELDSMLLMEIIKIT